MRYTLIACVGLVALAVFLLPTLSSFFASTETLCPKSLGNQSRSPDEDLTKPFFKPPRWIAKLEGGTWHIASADFNKDGLVDFAVTWSDPPVGHHGISIFYNQGNGVFKENRLNFRQLEELDDLDAADYDGDGDVDILFTHNEHIWYQGAPVNVNGTINLMRNDGKGNFSKPVQVAWLGPGVPYSLDNWINLEISSADFDNDGDIDFLVGGNCGWVALYKNDGTGNFSCANMIYDYGICSWGIASADFNNDGWTDFVVAANGSIYLKLNDHTPSCFNHTAGKILGSAHLFPFEIMIGGGLSGTPVPIDYNNDNKMDFVYGSSCSIYLFMNMNFTFKPFYVCMLLASNETFHHGGITVADFDGDGWQDMVTGGASGNIRFFANNKTFVAITYPLDKLSYFHGKAIYSLHPTWRGKCVVIGNITFRAEGLESLNRVEFYVDGELVSNDTTSPYEWEWGLKKKLIPRKHTVDAVAYRSNGEYGGRYRIIVWKIL